MQTLKCALAIALGATVALGACSPKEPRLMNLETNGTGPDEFGILPVKPLELPQNLAELPPPEPGGTNLVDPNPQADAIAALGGNPAVLTRGGSIPASDSGLVRYASRYGVDPDIRQVLAAEDLEFRQHHQGRVLERLFKTNVYYRAYRPMALNQHAELERWRAAGVGNVSAPPPQKGEKN